MIFYVVLVNSLSKFKNFSKKPIIQIISSITLLIMTPACRLLKSNKIEFSIHEYEHDSNAKSFGLEAAEKLNLDVR
ncbi:MAG: hypothetical protein KH152_11245, partial [Finegoldia magna]|nr:hypothetical protein [Finegoldia magna]